MSDSRVVRPAEPRAHPQWIDARRPRRVASDETVAAPGVRPWTELTAVFAAQFVVFGAVAALRLVAGDEGFYDMAAKLIAEGKRPWVDFFLPQMPLAPAVRAAWFGIFGANWFAARALDALLAAICGTLLFAALRPRAGLRFAALGALLLGASSFALQWFTISTTQGLSVVLLQAALHLVAAPGARASLLRTWFAGTAFGLAVCTRSFFVVAGPALLYAAGCAGAEAGARWRHVVVFGIAGGIVGLAMSGLVTDCWDAFWFANVTYHALRNPDATLVGGFGQKVDVLLQLVGLRPYRWAASLQFVLLVALAGLGCARGGLRDWRLRASAGVLASLFAVSWLPTPTFVLYFAVVIPFLIPHAVVGMRTFRSSRVMWACALAYVVLVPKDLHADLGWASPVARLGNRAQTHQWTLPEIREVSRLVDRVTAPGDHVITWWPGYLLESHAVPFPGMENHFGVGLAAGSQGVAYGITDEQVFAAIRDKKAPALVLGNWAGGVLAERRREFEQVIRAAGWTEVGAVGDTLVFRR